MSDAEPRYKKIEFCRSPKSLWGKLESGRWDWLGVHPDGQFVLGSPKAGGISGSGSLEAHRAEAAKGEHGIHTSVPNNPCAHVEWYETEDQAQEAFDRFVAEQGESGSPGIMRIRRIEKRMVVQEDFIVRRPSTYR
jgi:hypothetical protein